MGILEQIGLAAWEHEARGPDGQWTGELSFDDLDRHLESWFHPQRLDAARVQHPRSGYMVETGEERRVNHPERGQEGPATFEVWDHGDALTRPAGWFPRITRHEPIQHVYRAVSEDDWQHIQQARTMQSDQRGTIAGWEGTNAAADPRDAVSYLPMGGRGHVLKIRVDPADKWFTINADQYIRTRQPVPLDRIVAVSPLITKSNEGYLSLARITGQALELGWRFNPAEARNARGEWTRAGSGYVAPDTERLSIPRPAHPTKPYYGHPRDHPFFQEHPVSSAHIVAAYDASSPQEREQGMRWYADAHDIAVKIADGDADKGAGVLAAYSPQTSWPVNMFNADRAFDLGRAIGPGEGMITGAMQAHAQKAMDGAPADVANTASKTQAFARLIRAGGDEPDDQLGQVVIDRHAMTVAMGKRLPKKEADFAPIDKDRYYQHVADQYRLAAIEISKRGTPIAPHQLQAVTWLHQQTANQLEDEANHDRLARGRQTALRNAWQQWMKEAGNENIPVVSGTTGLAGGILAQIFDMAAWEHELRDSRGRWTRFGGVGTAADVMAKNREGFSVSVLTGGEPAHGYMVAQLDHTHVYPESILDDHAKLTRAIDDMLMSERSAFEGRDTYLGGWVHDGKLWLEPSDNILGKDEAVAEGTRRNQIAIWDVDNFEEIQTGGSGGGRITEHSNAQGAGQGPRGLLEQAGSGTAGYRLGDRGADQGRGILDQLDLAAWEHEARGPHGEWVRGGAGGLVKVSVDPDSGGWAHPVLNEATQVAIKNEIRKGMAAQEKYIPGIADKQVVNMVSHVPDAPEGSGALGETMKDGTIFILPKITVALAGKEAAKEAKAAEVDEGFWVPTDARYTVSDQVLAHEMGHVVGEHLEKRNRYMLLRSEYWAPIAKAIGILPPREGRTPGRIPFNNLAQWVDDNFYALQEAISVYGMSSPHEMQGELWSEFTLSSHPRPAAVAFGKYALTHLPPEDLPESAAYTQEKLFSRAGLA